MRIYVEIYVQIGIISGGIIIMNLDSWKINNLVVEIVFKPSPYFFKRKNELIEKLYMEFPNYNTQNNNLPGPIAMHTSDNPGINLNIFPNKFAIIFEKMNDENIISKGKDVCDIVIKLLEVNSIQRFGMRINLIKQMDLINADKILNSFINNKFKDLNLVNSSCLLNLTTSENANLRIALNRGMSQSIQIGPNLNNIQQAPISGIIADIDFFKVNIDSKDINHLIDIGLKEYEKCQLEID